MDEYGDIYYIDDARNAARDHRAQGGAGAGFRPAGMPVRPARTLVLQQPATAGVPQQPPQAMYYAQQPIMIGEPNPTASSILSRLTVSQLIEIACQAYAAMQTLPPPPNPTQETSTNVQNLILYQTALAQHAKRDEQVRTLGALVARLAG